MTRTVKILAATLTLLIVAGCGGGKRVGSGATSSDRYVETGLASWYGKPFHGRTTASGERYDMNELTAAHRTLAFGTVVDVRNLENGREVRVRITDRGPFVDGRIIDLSRAAARKIVMIEAGVVQVRIVAVE